MINTSMENIINLNFVNQIPLIWNFVAGSSVDNFTPVSPNFLNQIPLTGNSVANSSIENFINPNFVSDISSIQGSIISENMDISRNSQQQIM